MTGSVELYVPIFGAPSETSRVDEVRRSEHAEPISEKIESRGHAVRVGAKMIVRILSTQQPRVWRYIDSQSAHGHI